ncbi:hypothetical protein ALC62_02331 [Cyphomyrmex costatus]|uniref:Uncharacterized protein n=1 Tax=Cyphomyrmex costatus TaxID=456900 RepID=A0A195D192_9HYME|nr:hypothetical protein ALC62_02331 [Cyphomyrmex costatus]
MVKFDLNFARSCISCVSTCNAIYVNGRRAARTSNNNELAACARQVIPSGYHLENHPWDEEHAPLHRSFRPNDGYPGELTNNTSANQSAMSSENAYVWLDNDKQSDLYAENHKLLAIDLIAACLFHELIFSDIAFPFY